MGQREHAKKYQAVIRSLPLLFLNVTLGASVGEWRKLAVLWRRWFGGSL